MRAAGTLTFEGERSLSSIKEDKETGLIGMIFDSDGSEVCLDFEANCFDSMTKAIDEFRKKGEFYRDVTQGRIRSDFYLAMDFDKRVKIEVELEEAEDIPIFIFSSGKEKFELIFSVAQAKEFLRRCEKIVKIEEAKKDLQKSSVVKSQV